MKTRLTSPTNTTITLKSAFTLPGTGSALCQHQLILRPDSGEAQIVRDEGTSLGVSLKPSWPQSCILTRIHYAAVLVCSRSVMSDSCNLVDCNPPGSSVPGISQARIMEWVAVSFSRGSSSPRNRAPMSSALAGGFFTTKSPRKPSLERCCRLLLSTS